MQSLLEQKLFRGEAAQGTEGCLVLGAPLHGSIVAMGRPSREIPFRDIEQMLGVIEARWNVFPALIKALHDAKAHVPQGELRGRIEMLLARVQLEGSV